MIRKNIVLFVFLLALFSQTSFPHNGAIGPDPVAENVAEKYVRTELYFGLTKPDGSTLTDVEWSEFVDEIITPRFPDGFTVVDGKGQWRNKEGKIAKENSKMFIVVYPRKTRGDAGKKIEEIRSAYKKRFDQESVMRVDITKSIIVSF